MTVLGALAAGGAPARGVTVSVATIVVVVLIVIAAAPLVRHRRAAAGASARRLGRSPALGTDFAVCAGHGH